MKLVALRGEEPPDDAVVVVRGGANSLRSDVVERSAERNQVALGFFGLSVFLAPPDQGADMCRSVDEISRYGQVRRSTVGRLHAAGFAVIATGDAPHFDIVLPDVIGRTIERLASCFDAAEPNPGRA